MLKVCQAGYRELLSSLSWDGQMIWLGIGIWRWCALCTVVSLSWLNLLACSSLYFQRWFDRTTLSFDKQNLSGNAMHNKASDIIYYNWWIRPRSSQHLFDFAVQDYAFFGLTRLDNVEVWNSLFLYWLYYNSRAIWSLVCQPGYLSYPDFRIFTEEIST